ncbi:hypothetical protein AAG570_009865 [Ranatra chinensis]|uniref:Uncharacterized protein n=1 Tax=Ranatra chinensis TaxID=642074 RepID=A0ABD0ZBF9_9HEMI
MQIVQKHPHVIFEARTKASKGCANSGNLEWRMRNHRRGAKHVAALAPPPSAPAAQPTSNRIPRDVSEATKYIETALVIDKAMVIFIRTGSVPAPLASAQLAE